MRHLKQKALAKKLKAKNHLKKKIKNIYMTVIVTVMPVYQV